MKKNYLLLVFCILWNISSAQVTQIYTDFNNFWTSSSTSQNPMRPNLSHNLLAFRVGSTVYSTSVNNAKLAQNNVTYVSTIFRALPITSVPVTGSSSYFIGFGALQDGIQNGVSNTFINPLVTTGARKAFYLTDGPNGLNLGTGLTNIPSGNTLAFALSSTGIPLSQVSDDIPDILVSQFAQPTGTNDELYFSTLENGSTVVGTKVIINISETAQHPVVAHWNPDFYNNNSTQNSSDFVNTDRELRFHAAKLSAFGITAANVANAKYLIYKPGGSSDPAFIAFNEPAIPIAARLAITAQPITSNCDGTMPSSFTVQITDSYGGSVPQAGYIITASMNSGPGDLLGTLTATTDATGKAVFNNLTFEVGGDHTIQFTNTSLAPAISQNIAGPSCDDFIWTGNVNSSWAHSGNWTSSGTGTVPNANNNVTIPAGRVRYPILTLNAGAKNLVMGAGSRITLNGRLFTIKGDITKDPTAYIVASAPSSILYMSGSTAQTLPEGLINGNISNFTVENPQGVTTNTALNITEMVKVVSGNFETNGLLSLICSFFPRKTGLIGRLDGTISGNVTTEQCFPARRAFRFVSPSVTTTTSIRANWQENASAWNNNPNPGYGTHITGAGAAGTNPQLTDGVNGFDWQPSGASSMFTFSNATQSWSAVTSTSGNLVAGTPYRLMIRGSRSTDITSNASAPTDTKLRSTGTIRQGTVAISGLSAANNSWNFVGNPYHSVVDMNVVMSSAFNLTNFYYVWDPRVGGNNPIPGVPGGRGAYVAVNSQNGLTSNSSSAANRYLQPYQAFFVQTGTANAAPVLTFTEASKLTSTQTNVFRMGARPEIEVGLFYEEAFAEEATPTDGVRIDFGPDQNNEIDGNDAPKFGNLDENLSRKSGESLISMETRDMPQAGEELPLSLTQYRKQAYVFKLTLGTFNDVDVYLKDAYLNETTLLEKEGTTNYNFSVDTAIEASTAPTRFSILFTEAAMGTGETNTDSFSIFPNPVKSGNLFINTTSAVDSASVEIFNTLGQKVLESKGSFAGNNQMAVKVDTLQAGAYIVKVKSGTGTVYSAKFIKE
ncbi:T9SS type A sorting domain-containing protein [uncultured Flavobacterium sp.]|uniref:T9SS type A sorting domain-containing protein n=1 Tax=uncultured Flavobacterium sp. TaxID=165435 RepID=UPI0025DD75D3|nr:T9SS type A sorting domain-containing protein [uncultured Flavobacterium sp.]